jgi:hypothetical protein
MNIYILQQSQKHRCQKADIWDVPLRRFHKTQASPVVLGSLGDCKSLDYFCYFTHFCVLFTSVYTFEIKIPYVFWRLYIAKCGMLFWKARKMKFKLHHNLLQDMKSICTFKTLPSNAQVSESFADIPQAHVKTELKCIACFSDMKEPPS